MMQGTTNAPDSHGRLRLPDWIERYRELRVHDKKIRKCRKAFLYLNSTMSSH
jgi:hypothetical protein